LVSTPLIGGTSAKLLQEAIKGYAHIVLHDYIYPALIAVVDHCFKDDKIKDHAVNKVASMIHDEIKKMCSHTVNSILQRTSATSSFQWVDLINELEVHAPTLMTILNSATKTRCYRCNRSGVIGMCAAMLLRFRYSRMSLVQKLISIILYVGHSGKQLSIDYGVHILYV